MFCLVAVNTPFNNSLLAYRYDDTQTFVQKGALVYVAFGKRKEAGCVLETDYKLSKEEELFKDKIKNVASEHDLNFSLSPKQLDFFHWTAKYYHYPLGQHLFDCLPKALKRPRQLKWKEGKGQPLDFNLSHIQKEYSQKVLKNIGFKKWLLHGVTGSGKSVVYLDIFKEITKTKQALFLLPEINLTPQFLSFFEEHLSVPIFIYNSAISNSDKYQLWKELETRVEPCLIVGVRSAIHLPAKNLGVIIVDEEHDQSFKQDDRCPYNARDLSIKKAQQDNISVVLGSATPSFETYYNHKNDSSYLPIENRIEGASLPEIIIVDERQGKESEFNESLWPLTIESVEEIQKALDREEQVLVFLNRLGFANFIQCKGCGHQFHCLSCSSNLKYYKKRKELKCHFCDFKAPFPEVCPSCSNLSMMQKGYGTERIESLLIDLFPKHKTGRFDRDLLTTSKKVFEQLDAFHRGDLDIMVGTQMLSKGHNFKKVNLVLILGIDSSLNFPDFRSQERAYQQLVQVSGRSGRFGKKANVLVQTLNPENPLFQLVKTHSFDGFYKNEEDVREICHAPPFYRMTMIYLTSKFQDKVIDESLKLKNQIDEYLKHFKSVELLGPRPAIMEKRANKFTWALMLRSTKISELHNLLDTIKKNSKFHHSISFKIDVDPYSMS